MLSLNVLAPEFSLEGIVGGTVRRYSLAEFRGRWTVLFFYPADFTFVCPTEILGFHRLAGDFSACGTVVLGVSIDDIDSHRAWAQELGGLAFPLLSDPTRATCHAYGVLNEADQRSWRATFLITPEGRLGYMVVSPMNVGRSVGETLRVVQACQTGRLCPAEWKPGDPTLDPELNY